MSKFTDMLQSMMPKKFRKKVDTKKKNTDADIDNPEEDDEEEEKDTPVGGVSVNEGTHEKVFGVRRDVVKGVGVFFAVIVLMAIISASSDTDKKQVAQNVNEMQSSEDDINKNNKSKNKKGSNQAENYGDLMEMNRKKAEEEARAKGIDPHAPNGATPQGNANPNNPTQGTMGQNNNAVAPVVIPRATTIPTIPQIPATAQAPAQTQAQPSQQQATQQQPQRDSRYTAAIAFGVGGVSAGTGNSNAGGTSENAVSGGGSGQTATPQVVSIAPISASAMNVTPRSITIGTVIPVRLMTGINSDSPGQVMAMIITDVRDSLTGNTVLIPAGSRLFGSLGQSVAAKGRINLTFSTILTPDNRSFNIGSAFEAMDGLGYSGIKGKVDKHTEVRIGGGMLAAGIAALGSMAAGNTNGNSQTYSAGQLASQGALASLINQATAMIQQGSNIGPTVTVKPGYEFSVYVNQTIQF